MRTKSSKTKSASSKTLIKEKITVLDDFGICSKHDRSMIEKFENVIEQHPDKEPRSVLDMYCRSIIQEKVNSWT